MAQNVSSAVMQQRAEPQSSLDYFGTPPWATRALLERLNISKHTRLWDPACGRGFMTRPMSEYSECVMGSDIHDYGFGSVLDFLSDDAEQQKIMCDWVIANPPFKAAAEFVYRGLTRSSRGVAVLVRTAFAEGRGRYNNLFKQHRPSFRFQFVDRVVMHKGDPPDPDIPLRVWDKRKEDFVMRKPSTATSYEWMVWDRNVVPSSSNLDAMRNYNISSGTVTDWLATARKELTRVGDYDDPAGGRVFSL